MSKKRTGIKLILMFAIAFSIMWAGETKTYAQTTVSEEEPNDTRETAQLIQANKETAVQAASGQYPDKYSVYGYADTSDTDWYKVYLATGEQYVTCNGFDFDFCVYDENNNVVLQKSYSKSSYGLRAYPFYVHNNGYYYIKINGITSSSEKYIILVGDPVYTSAHCKINLGSVNMAENAEFKRLIDLTNENSIPEDALIYDMAFYGLRTSNAKYATVNNKTKGYTKSFGPSIYSIHNIASLGLKVRSDWEFKIGCIKNKAIDAEFTMYFVYPVKSEYLPNNEIVFNAY